MNSEFGSLKPDSVIDIFNAAVSASKLTRAELAERCGDSGQGGRCSCFFEGAPSGAFRQLVLGQALARSVCFSGLVVRRIHRR